MRRTTILNAAEVKRTLFREAEASFCLVPILRPLLRFILCPSAVGMRPL